MNERIKTGYRDISGEDIHENDVLIIDNPNLKGMRFVYVVDNYENTYNIPYVYRRMEEGELEVVGRVKVMDSFFATTKILGNSIDNPELIKTTVK